MENISSIVNISKMLNLFMLYIYNIVTIGLFQYENVAILILRNL